MNDDELLDALARSLAPVPAEPSALELATFREARATGHRGGAVVTFPGRRSWLAMHRSSVAAAAAALVLVSGASVVAWHRNPVDVAVQAVGLDRGGTAKRDAANDAIADLRHALAGGDPAAVAHAAAAVRSRLTKVEADDRARLAGDAGSLLQQADALVAAGRTTAGPGPGGSGPSSGPGPVIGPSGSGSGSSGSGSSGSGSSGSGSSGSGSSGSGSSGSGSSGSGSGGSSPGGPAGATTSTTEGNGDRGSTTTTPASSSSTSSTTSTTVDNHTTSTTAPDNHRGPGDGASGSGTSGSGTSGSSGSSADGTSSSGGGGGASTTTIP